MYLSQNAKLRNLNILGNPVVQSIESQSLLVIMSNVLPQLAVFNDKVVTRPVHAEVRQTASTVVYPNASPPGSYYPSGLVSIH